MGKNRTQFNDSVGGWSIDPIDPNSTDTVDYRIEDHVGTITLTRSDRLNAVTAELYAGLVGALERAADDDSRVVVLTGEGRAFCVGADLKEHGERERTPAEKRDYAWSAQRACRRLQTHPQPVIAKVRGYAIGAGAELALSADLIVMAEDAEVQFPEAGIGTYVGGGVTYTLPARVGRARAKELVLTAATVPGPEAREMGLADRVVPNGELDAATANLAEEIAGNAPIPVAMAKAQFSRPVTDHELALTAEVEGLLTCMETADWQEGIDAFDEDREPEFRGA